MNNKSQERTPFFFDDMRKAIGLLKLISQGEEDIRQRRFREQEDVFRDMEVEDAPHGS